MHAIMTLQRARELLDEEDLNLSDSELQELLKNVTDFCSVLLDIVLDDIVHSRPASSSIYGKNSSSVPSS